MRTKIAAVLGWTLLLTLVPGAVGTAAPDDAPAAALTNATDQAAAAAQPQDPDVTCSATAGGRDLVQHQSLPSGSSVSSGPATPPPPYPPIFPGPPIIGSPGVPDPGVPSEIEGQEWSFGGGSCVSLDATRAYAVRLTIRMQWFDRSATVDGDWRDIPCTASSGWTGAVAGVAVAPPASLICAYSRAAGWGYLDRYHRGRVVLETSLGTRREAYTPIWYMQR